MKPSTILILGLAAAVAPIGARADTHSCIDRACKAGEEKPPACCKPPPCTFFRQIKMKAALQKQFADARLRAQAMKETGDRGPRAFARLTDIVRQMARDGKTGKALPACSDDPTKDPPEFHTNAECQRSDADGPISEESAQRKYDTCREFIAAEFRHEDLHKGACSSENSTQRAKDSLAKSADEEVNGYENEIGDLRLDLRKFWIACSPSIDAETRAKIVDAGVDILTEGK